MKEIRVEEYFSIGFQLGKRTYWTIFFNFLIYFILGICASITVVGILVLPALFAGFTKFLLKAARGEEVDVGDSLSEGFKNGMWWKSLLFFDLAFLGVVVGFLLLILPGLYLSTAWILGFYLLVDKGMLPLEALGKSRELVHQLGFWKIFVIVMGLGIATQVTAVIPFLGLLLIFLLPFIIMIYVAIYENAIGNPLAVTKEK
ncbi:MAG: hypothetical protein ACJ0BT_02235 [Pseudohongiellaceae bacterium]